MKIMKKKDNEAKNADDNSLIFERVFNELSKPVEHLTQKTVDPLARISRKIIEHLTRSYYLSQRTMDGWKIPRKRSSAIRKYIDSVELFSHVLPAKVRAETFEPSFHDEKSSYLESRRRFTSRPARVWLGFCFGLHVFFMVFQCLWGMCSERIKKILLDFLPQFLRRIISR